MSKNVTLSQSQMDAVDMYEEFLDDPEQGFMVISGFAGSGKSFLVKYLQELTWNWCDLQKSLNPHFKAFNMYYTATTNKAAEVLRGVLGRNLQVSTIHSLLKLKVTNDYKTGRTFLEQRDGRPPATPDSVIFVDESSMVNRELLVHISNHQKYSKNCKFVFIGDPYQLPPVTEGLCPIFKAQTWHAFLNEIQRQVKGSPIIQYSSAYRAVLDDPKLDWPAVPHDGHTILHYDDESKFRKAIQKHMGQPHPVDEYKVLAWSNQKVREYNHWIRMMHGHTDPFEVGDVMMTNKPLMRGAEIIYPTDALVKIRNVRPDTKAGISGYQVTIEGTTRHTEVFQPADWAEVRKVLSQLAKEKNWKAYFHIKEQWADLRPVHALTCHKAQGSTYREVFIDLQNIGLNRKWHETARLAYVAVSRAKERIHVLGNLGSVNYPSKDKCPMGVFKNALNHLS